MDHVSRPVATLVVDSLEIKQDEIEDPRDIASIAR